MRNMRPSRRQIEMNADDLDFDFFADTTGLAGDVPTSMAFGGVADLADLFAEIAEFDQELRLLDAELLAHEVHHAVGDAIVLKLRLGEISTVRGWAA
ncbi:hypothetical protein [Amycolatopsis sp. CB00013]|uniref:hypothetical protein n=1 Tax=Amycolatopsis sp. CB00013 TaxID=1703945 RepID=UPI000960B081|nr:hypothetical protein [Amycolatopsis sp. CB00013]OKJ93842.1 hypothetical protein AMK34_26830 [Amycolatopsis sp. CB00013]